MSRIQALGDWLRTHPRFISRLQWGVVGFYLFLIVVPALLPLPSDSLQFWQHLTLLAQFAFWGIWWPLVLTSILLLGRTWCGLFCPEGTLTEWSSRHGLQKAIPRWVRWKGWPFTAFCLTTLYGQLTSVYQYPKPTLLILGGSTAAAMAVGFLYGREKRVWCRYLCPVNGVFSLLAKLAPLHFKVDEAAWHQSYHSNSPNGSAQVIPIQAVNCAPLVPLRQMKGAADCHMCGRCSGHRQAIHLQLRSPNQEIVQFGQNGSWAETILLLYGILGVAMAAFQWTLSPTFVALKQKMAEAALDYAPAAFSQGLFHSPGHWFILTYYPQQSDVLTWFDGLLLIGYTTTTALVYGSGALLLLSLAVRCLGSWSFARLHHLAQSLIPMAAASLVVGLLATTLSILKLSPAAHYWSVILRSALLLLASGWSFSLAWSILADSPGWRRALACLCIGLLLAAISWIWWQILWVW